MTRIKSIQQESPAPGSKELQDQGDCAEHQMLAVECMPLHTSPTTS